MAYVTATVRLDIYDRLDGCVVLRAIRVWLERTRLVIGVLRGIERHSKSAPGKYHY